MGTKIAVKEYAKPAEPLVSVVVPVYRAEQYLETCVDSLLQQSYQALEIILVDDGSPDSCGELCDRYAEQDSRVKVIHQSNRGVSAARNAGVQLASGAYIAFVDADDWVDPQYIAHMAECAERQNADLVVCRCETEVTNVTGEIKLSREEAVRALLYQKWFDTAPWSKLYRAEIAKEIPFPEGMFFEDLAVVCRMFGLAEKVIYSTKQLYHYRKTPGSTMNSMDIKKLRDELTAADMMYDYVSRELPALEPAAACRRFSACCQVLLKLPEADCDAERKKVWTVLRQDRTRVLWDKQARAKNRLAAALSYLGEGVMHRLWNVRQ